jgi:hypothetical protein
MVTCHLKNGKKDLLVEKIIFLPTQVATADFNL